MKSSKNPSAVDLGKLRWKNVPLEKRQEHGRQAVKKRWEKTKEKKHPAENTP